ncbi:biotin transporter BioY [Thalassobacillus pellis]|uniref:biotin transporter BioY n=1 Tax=Thalassobacillus pellis TaxID=748008 RepID=UPI001961ED5C|nr:biotin transporter BioY [Thalassobacillus pellis]MBM7553795.1 biotin transport system substrate-specific component [Thalassobacillus pellis]
MKKNRWSTLDLTMGSLFVALTAIGANITSIAPFLVIGGVPITLQTFFAILAGIVLGSRLGAFSMFVYMLLGLAGAPIFAQFKGGAGIIMAPTFGFIVSFIILAFVAGKIVETKRTFPRYIIASITGLIINYVIGTNWMYAAYQLWFEAPGDLSYQVVWGWMMVPLPKDIVLAVAAAVVGYNLEKGALSRSQFRRQNNAA